MIRMKSRYLPVPRQPLTVCSMSYEYFLNCFLGICSCLLLQWFVKNEIFEILCEISFVLYKIVLRQQWICVVSNFSLVLTALDLQCNKQQWQKAQCERNSLISLSLHCRWLQRKTDPHKFLLFLSDLKSVQLHVILDVTVLSMDTLTDVFRCIQCK